MTSKNVTFRAKFDFPQAGQALEEGGSAVVPNEPLLPTLVREPLLPAALLTHRRSQCTTPHLCAPTRTRARTHIHTHAHTDELAFVKGDYIIGQEQMGDWWSGCLADNPERVGLFPANYVEAAESPEVKEVVAPSQVTLQRVESWKPKRRSSLSRPAPDIAAALARSAAGSGEAKAGAGSGPGAASGSSPYAVEAAAKAAAGTRPTAPKRGGGGAVLGSNGNGHGGAATADGAAAAAAEAGEPVKKKEPKKALPLIYGLWGHYMARLVGPMYGVFGLACLLWATSDVADGPELAATNASVLVGLICMFACPLMVFVEHQYPRVVPLFQEYAIPFRGIMYLVFAVPALLTLPTLIAGFCGAVTGAVNMYAVVRGERSAGARKGGGRGAKKKTSLADDYEDASTATLTAKFLEWLRHQREADKIGQFVLLILYGVGNFWYAVDTLAFYFGLIGFLDDCSTRTVITDCPQSFLDAGLSAPSYWAAFAKVGGALLNLNASMLLVPVVRGALAVLNRKRIGQRATLATYLPLRKNIAFHKLVAKIVLASAVLHIVCHFINFSFAPAVTLALFPNPDDAPWYGAVKTAPWYTGALITVSMFFIFSAAPSAMKAAKYEVFWNSHHFFVLFYVNCLFHGPVFLYWSILPISMYVAERCFRVRRGRREIYLLSVKWVEPVLEIVWKPRQKDEFQFVEGEYLYLNCPYIASDEWHPFTISSAVGDLKKEGFVTNHIRVYPKGWTGKLRQYLELMNPTGSYEFELTRRDPDSAEVLPGKLNGPDAQQILRIDGPHAAPSMHYNAYETVMLIGAGIGLTPAAAIIRAVLRYKWRMGFNVGGPDIVHFYWVVRQNEVESFQWFVALLTSLMAQLQRDRSTNSVAAKYYLEMNVYVTRAEDSYPTPKLQESAEIDPTLREFAPFTAQQLLSAIVHPRVKSKSQVEVQRSPDTATNKLGDIWIWNGRPDWDGIFAAVADPDRVVSKDIGVCFCGAYVIGKDLKDMCEKHSSVETNVTFHLHKENF